MKLWKVKIGLKQGGERNIEINANSHNDMVAKAQAQYPGCQVRNYSCH